MKTNKTNGKPIKRLVSLAIALVMTVAALSAFAFSCSAETGTPDVSSGATQNSNGGDGNSYFSWGDTQNGEQNGLPGQNTDNNGGFQTPPSGGNGNTPSLPELPNQNGNNGQSGNDANGNQQFQQPPTGSFGGFNGNVDFGGGFNYSEATFWLLVGITGVALISLCAVGLTKLAKRGKKAQPAAQPASEPAQPAE